MVIWLVGLSGAGKTTIGEELCSQIRATGRKCVLIDGDVIREIFGHDLGHSLDDRRKNADRICRLCRYLESEKVNVVCAILSIFHESQEWNRENISNYYQVFVDAPLELVQSRDIKGIYQKAIQGELKSVVGVDIPFPTPLRSDMVIENDFTLPVVELAQRVLFAIENRLLD